MNNSKTVEVLNKFYSIFNDNCTKGRDMTPDENNFIRNFELEIAKTMINEFDKTSVRKIANIILVATE